MKKGLFVVISAFAILHFIIFGSALSQTNDKVFEGYTLFQQLFGTTTYLINMDGKIVHEWDMENSAGFSTYFLDNGHLFRSASRTAGGGMMGGGMMGGMMGGRGGRGGQRGGAPGTQEFSDEKRQPGGIGVGGKIQEIDWDGNVVWEYIYATETEVPHHDIERMPNDNILLICWDAKSALESIEAGRNPAFQSGEQNPDCIVELKPTGPNTAEVVWKWYAWDHIIQDFDPNKPNYGKVSEHPELINLNYTDSWDDTAPGAGQGNRRGGAGGMGGGMMGGGGPIPVTDWTHFNAIDYNEELDLIIVSSYTISEIWVIDHSTTTEEAAGHAGGKHGKGGDLIYRYGNPAAYKQGTIEDKKFFSPHNIHWIEKGLPGEGHLLIFNNGPNRLDGNYSSVEEFTLPIDENGKFKMNGKVFADVIPVWQYTDPNKKTNFYSQNIAGAQRLPNGNTLICEGASGHFFEVTSDKEIVWEFDYSTSGLGGAGGARGGMMGGGFGGGQGARGGAGMMGGAGAFGGGMRGMGAAPADANSAAPQGQRGAGMAGMRGQLGQGAGAGAFGGARAGGARGGARGGGMGGFNMANQIFRAVRIPADHPALKGKELTPIKNDTQN
ncbi:MAG: aryl-sulfate sulfotransferase [Sedimentisphaerales bacterium]|nr:aryl-sulfate sulfotransferase [Sedimentisphaerales bacterium]